MRSFLIRKPTTIPEDQASYVGGGRIQEIFYQQRGAVCIAEVPICYGQPMRMSDTDTYLVVYRCVKCNEPTIRVNILNEDGKVLDGVSFPVDGFAMIPCVELAFAVGEDGITLNIWDMSPALSEASDDAADESDQDAVGSETPDDESASGRAVTSRPPPDLAATSAEAGVQPAVIPLVDTLERVDEEGAADDVEPLAEAPAKASGWTEPGRVEPMQPPPVLSAGDTLQAPPLATATVPPVAEEAADVPPGHHPSTEPPANGGEPPEVLPAHVDEGHASINAGADVEPDGVATPKTETLPSGAMPAGEESEVGHKSLPPPPDDDRPADEVFDEELEEPVAVQATEPSVVTSAPQLAEPDVPADEQVVAVDPPAQTEIDSGQADQDAPSTPAVTVVGVTGDETVVVQQELIVEAVPSAEPQAVQAVE